MENIKVLIVDDSALVRQTFRTLLESDPGIEVIGTAGDPYIAVQKIQKERPDVITLDIEMPRMDGLTFLKKIMMQAPMPVVVISDQTLKGADVALKALEMGAVDVMSKPGLSTENEIAESRIRLVDKVRSAYYAKNGAHKKMATPTPLPTIVKPVVPALPLQVKSFSSQSIIAIGASTGGTEALKSFLEALPTNMPPIVVVQHMPEKFTASFAKRLDDVCAIKVVEARDGEPLLSGTVYIAPGDDHMILRVHQGKTYIKLYKGELVSRHRPSVNVLFHSIAEARRKHAIGIIMTGMGDDGATGLLAMHQKGAFTIAQDESSCVVFGMPHEAIQCGAVSKVLPLHEIPREVCERIGVPITA